MKKVNKASLPIILVFIIINSAVLVFKSFFVKHGFDTDFLLIANLILLALSVMAFIFQRKGLQSSNTNFFIRTVYMSMIIKMFVCMIAILVYAFINRSNINKPSLFTSMGLYVVYTFIEVSALMKNGRKKTNA